MGQRDQGLGENTLRWGKLIGRMETPVLGELISPKTLRLHGGTKESPMGVLGSPAWLFLCERERSEKNGEGVSSVQGV
jgi:hypothetical protein